MFDSGVLDVAIGITVVYILVSTLCSAIREGVEAWLKTRAVYLEYGIRELLHDRGGQGLAQRFFTHPLINGLYQGDYKAGSSAKLSLWRRGRNLPSYIPARSFALTLMDLAARGPTASPGAPATITFESLRASVRTLQNPAVQRVLTSAIDFGQGDLDKVRRHLEAWYDGTMDRVSGWYKRSTQWIIFVTALIVVGVLNINTITILDGLYRNQALRAAVVNAAPHDANNLSYDGALVAFDKLRLPIGWDRGWGAPKSVQEQRLLVPKGPIPFDLWNDAFAPVLGLLITAFAATLGAPFWFDMLNKVTALRATLKPREKSPEEATQDREPVRGPAVNGARHELTLNVGPGVGTTTVSSGVQLQGADPEHDVDGCHERIELATLDEELPLAQGGVG